MAFITTMVLAMNVTNAGMPRLGVMPLRTSTLPEGTVRVLEQLVVNGADQLQRFEVVSAADVNAMLGLERMKDLVGCDSASCAAEIAGALGVELILNSSADVLGDSLIMTSTLLDVAAAKAIKREQIKMANRPDDYFDATLALVRRTFEDGVAHSGSAVSAPGSAAPAAVSTTAVLDRVNHNLGVGFVVRNGTVICSSGIRCSGEGSSVGRHTFVNGVDSTDMVGAGVIYGFPVGSYAAVRAFVGAVEGDPPWDDGLFATAGGALTYPLMTNHGGRLLLPRHSVALGVYADGETVIGDQFALGVSGGAKLHFFWLELKLGYGWQPTRNLIVYEDVYDAVSGQSTRVPHTLAYRSVYSTVSASVNLQF